VEVVPYPRRKIVTGTVAGYVTGCVIERGERVVRTSPRSRRRVILVFRVLSVVGCVAGTGCP
jgi:hypothetical protein